jgi:tetratricopeptide (TPR) repeat protein
MEGYLFQKRYKDALQSIDSLDYKIGGDDFLDYFRANIYFLTDDFENAEKNLSSLIVNFPDFFQPYQNLFILYVRHNKYSQAVSILENIQMKFNLEKANLIIEIANDFPEFSESPEFEDWKSF